MDYQSPRGRKAHKFYGKLRFISKKLENGRTAAQCTICHALLKNTSVSRLHTHRRRCYTNSIELENCSDIVYDIEGNRMVRSNDDQDVDIMSAKYPEDMREKSPMTMYTIKTQPNDTEVGEMIVNYDTNDIDRGASHNPTYAVHDEGILSSPKHEMEVESAEKDHNYTPLHERKPSLKVRNVFEPQEIWIPSATTTATTSTSLCTTPSNSFLSLKGSPMSIPYEKSLKISAKHTKKIKTESCNIMPTTFIEATATDTKDDIDMALAKFFLGCNVPLSMVESDHFKNFIKIVRPSYDPPCRKILSTSLMDRVKNEMMITNRKYAAKMTSLLIDGFKMKNNGRDKSNVITMLQAVGGQSMFLESYDLSKTEETEEGLANICEISIELAKTRYGCEVYAVVSDNTANMTEIGSLTGLWHVTCSSHTGHLLLDDIVDRELMSKLNTVLKEFKITDLETTLVKTGGSGIILPIDTRWCAKRDACECFANNLTTMKKIVTESFITVKPEVTYLLYDDDFVERISNTIRLLNPICELIKKSHGVDSSIADTTEEWLDIYNKIPEDLRTKEIQAAFARRVKMATNVYSLTANYLCPMYRGQKLSRSQMNLVHEFLLNFLDNEGLNGLYAFERGMDIFEKLFQKKVMSRNVFWGFAEIKFPSLAALAQKLLKIPASSSRIQRVREN